MKGWPVLLLLAGLVAGLLTACNRSGPAPAEPSPSLTTPSNATQTGPAASATPFQPSPTPTPLAARVNGIELSLADYQAELARYQAAQGVAPTPEDEQRVLSDLIDQALLAQAAAENGFVVDEATLQARVDGLAARLGGAEALDRWMAANGYIAATFRRDLERSITAAWMRDRIAATVPDKVEQIHARQILLYNETQANEVLAQLNAGQDFTKLAAQIDPVTEGDLGWFSRGYLPHPALEEAAFSLEPGKWSGVIATPAGFHILLVIERDPQRTPDPEARRILEAEAVRLWLQDSRSQGDIQILLP